MSLKLDALGSRAIREFRRRLRRPFLYLVNAGTHRGESAVQLFPAFYVLFACFVVKYTCRP